MKVLKLNIMNFDKVSRPGIAAEMNMKLTSENSEFEQYFNIKSILKFEKLFFSLDLSYFASSRKRKGISSWRPSQLKYVLLQFTETYYKRRRSSEVYIQSDISYHSEGMIFQP